MSATAAPYPRPYGPYVLLERIGQGGMSEVDLATRAVDDADFVRFLVIKRIHAQHSGEESFVRMFQDEARINAELQHENIASVYDFGLEGDEFFLAMEYVPGCDLRRLQRLLARRGQFFPIRIALRILADVLAALDYAHHRVDTYGRSMNIVHRDVNPRNIMISVRGEVKLIDFGVAKADNRADQTVGHSIKGKFAYMAPEQIEARGPIDGRADLFAVGIILHELLSNQSPFAGLSEVQTMHRILGGQIPAVASSERHPIPDDVLDILDRALAVNRDQRFRDAAQMRQAVVNAAERAGGLPSRAELADFLRRVDPETSGVSARLDEWRQGGLPKLLSTPSPGATPRSHSRSVKLDGGGAGSVAGRASVHPSAVPRSSESGTFGGSVVERPPSRLLPAVGVGLGIGMVALVVALAAFLWDWRPTSSVERAEAGGVVASGPAIPAAGTPPPSASTASPPDPEPGRVASPEAASGSRRDAPAAEPPRGSTGRPSGEARPPEAGASKGAAVEAPPPDPRAEAGPREEPAPSPPPDEPRGGTGGTSPASTSPASTGGASSASPPTEPAPSASTTSASTTSASTTSASTTSASTTSAGEATSASSSGSAGGATGFLNISSRPTNLELFIDGKAMGRTPARALELPIGARTVMVRDPASGQTWQKQVKVEQGRAQVVVLGDGT